MTIEHAIEVFVHGFAFTRSVTHPYVVERLLAGLWIMQDAPRSRGQYRNAELVACRVPADTVAEAARRLSLGQHHVSVIEPEGDADGVLRSAYRGFGYRYRLMEPFFTHDLARIDDAPEPLPIERVTTVLEAEKLAKAARSRQVLPEHLEADPPPMRQYAALDAGNPVGWVGCVSSCGCTWCTNLYVQPEYRRKGIARALLTRMLQDDRAAGAEASILLSSSAGAKLYPTVGYKTIGELFAFVPKRQRPAAVTASTADDMDS